MNYSDYQKLYEEKKGTLQECLNLIKSGDRLWTSNNYNEPTTFFAHLHEIGDRVENVFVHMSRIGNYPFMTDPEMNGRINFGNYFFGPRYRVAVMSRNCTFFPSDLPNYYRNASKEYPWNVFVAQVSPMTEDGKFYLGMNQTFESQLVKDALEDHKTIILEVNDRLTWMRGATSIPIEAVTMLYEDSKPEYVTTPITCTDTEIKIGMMVADLVEDGDTIQMGIGGIPDAVGSFLADKKDLGLHTEQFTSSMATLIEKGVITGSRKAFDAGEHVGVFADGTPELYKALHDNPQCILKPGNEVVNPFNIARQDHMVSINTCVEIDLTGQVSAESLGYEQISGSGGGFCFTLGTFYAEHGKGILAFPSRTKKGGSKIRTTFRRGTVITHQRNYIDYVVTEYGCVRLRGCSVADRARKLISIAHPDDRDQLTFEAKKMRFI